MLGIVGCITLHHDPRLVTVAGLLCGTACFTSVSMLWRSLSHQGLAAAAWLGGAAFAFGCGVWSTHFLAMQAYDSPLIAGYDLLATGCSLVIASIGALAAFALFLHVRHAAQPGFAGVLLGASIAAMHFIGFGAMRVRGYVTFDSVYVMASLAAGMVLAGAGLSVTGTLHALSRRVAGSLCMTAAVVALHFTAMT
ncbi:MAG TPA: MHYT domain-containing protein, partial [Rhodopila sp.]|nr:MHYT domain-containing protein [Rhodopila sp.]